MFNIDFFFCICNRFYLGIDFGDEYLAELDHIEVVEQAKEGYESDVPEQSNQSLDDMRFINISFIF